MTAKRTWLLAVATLLYHLASCRGLEHGSVSKSAASLTLLGKNRKTLASTSGGHARRHFSSSLSAKDNRLCVTTAEKYIECLERKRGNLWDFKAYDPAGRTQKELLEKPSTCASKLKGQNGPVCCDGKMHNCSIAVSGGIQCSGDDSEGQSNSHKIKQASNGKFVSVDCGDWHTCGVTSTGAIECFGLDYSRQANGGKPKTALNGKFVQVSASGKYTCGLTDHGTVECFGQGAPNVFDYSPLYYISSPSGFVHKRGKLIECPRGTFSNGNQTNCTKCPDNKPLSSLQAKSMHECRKVPPGHGFNRILGKLFSCDYGEYNTGNDVTCKKCPNDRIKSPKGSESQAQCTAVPAGYEYKGGKETRCLGGTYSFGNQFECSWCPPERPNSPAGSKSDRECKSSLGEINALLKSVEGMKEGQNDISIKTSRLWQREQIRMHHDRMMDGRKDLDNKKEKVACEDERRNGNIVFPAIEIENEIEKVEGTTCIDTNRDEMLKSFCSFTTDLDNLFLIQNIQKEAKAFWPNICCKERRDAAVEVCEDPSGKKKRGEIVPFALSSGGNYSRHNLYVEVADTIKQNGYLHKGMNRLIDTLPSIGKQKKRAMKRLIGTFFNDVSLCGPRIIDAPDAKDKKKLCELFIPYNHAMTSFFEMIERLYMKPTQASFLETMEMSLDLRQQFPPRLGKNRNVGAMMQVKKKDTKTTCSTGSRYGSRSKLARKKEDFCKGYKHLDLSDTRIKNIAVQYLKNDITLSDQEMFSLSHRMRYQVKDTSCPSPLFTANDISIQQVAMDALGTEKEWVAVVNLNTKDDDGYLQSELPYCEERSYLIGTSVSVKAYVDSGNYCGKLVDYNECRSKCLAECRAGNCRKTCAKKLVQLKNRQDKHYSKEVVLMGTQYTVSSISKRRRLLYSHQSGC